MALLVAFILGNFCEANEQDYIIDVDFPGGNIIVNKHQSTSTLYYELSEDIVSLRPDMRDTKRDWFYWCFRVSGAENRTLQFKFPGGHVGPFGPAISIDGGKTWRWLLNSATSGNNGFQYTFDGEAKEVLFSSVIPYLQSHFNTFIASIQNSRLVNIGSLTTSGKGRRVEKLIIQKPKTTPQYRVLLTARHHACEAMASYVLEGIIDSVLQGDDTSMQWLRENVSFFIVPFMDKDGVEDGDQGKNRKPWDHLSDYGVDNIYKSTGALRQQVPEWAQGNLNLALDLHCPGLRGKWGTTIYIVGSSNEEYASKQRAFMDILKQENKGEIKLHPTNSIIEYGTAWNGGTPAKTKKRTEKPTAKKTRSSQIGFMRWASQQGGDLFFGLNPRNSLCEK